VSSDELCRCGTIAHRTLGTIAYCERCADELLEPIRARIITNESGAGHGTQTGPLRPDYGRGWADLTCTVCHYQWTGPIGEPCSTCEARTARLVEEQRRRLLRPELPEATSARWAAAVDSWHERLARAVTAGTITAHEADAATSREQAAA
jgi:hypothetical protein